MDFDKLQRDHETRVLGIRRAHAIRMTVLGIVIIVAIFVPDVVVWILSSRK